MKFVQIGIVVRKMADRRHAAESKSHRLSGAAADLLVALRDSSPQWMVFDSDCRFAVRNDLVMQEGVELLNRIATNSQLPSDLLGSLQIGFNQETLIPILDGLKIAHALT